MKSIEIEVGPGGEVAVEAVGFKGKGCEAATEAIEKAIGVASGERRFKPEHKARVEQQVRAGL